MIVLCYKQILTIYGYIKELIPLLASGSGIDLKTLKEVAQKKQQQKQKSN
jgi:hypothetical protein